MRRYEQERWSPTATHRKRETETRQCLSSNSSLVNGDKRGVAATKASYIMSLRLSEQLTGFLAPPRLSHTIGGAFLNFSY